MKYTRVRSRERGTVLGSRVAVADTWWLRLRGLLGRPRLRAGEGMLLAPCAAAHTWGMRYPIDIAFLKADGEVLATYDALPPGARTRWHRSSACALELPAGTLRQLGTRPGEVLVCETLRSGEPPPAGAQPANTKMSMRDPERDR